METKKKRVLSFISKEILAAVATVDESGNPEVATMVVSQTDDLDLIFQTPNYYRKYKNIKNNPNIAVTFGFSLEDFTTVQFEGVANEAKGDEIEMCRKIYVGKNPRSKRYAHLPENKYFIVKPKWIRYWNFNKDEKFEMKF